MVWHFGHRTEAVVPSGTLSFVAHFGQVAIATGCLRECGTILL
jgi:hypothetical protein